MPEYGTRANNDEVVMCHWCDFEVEPGAQTVEIGIIGFYGHARCWRRRQKGHSKIDIHEMERAYREQENIS